MAGNPNDTARALLLRRATYVGEGHAALLRLGAIAAFYAVELLAEYGARLGFLQLADRSGLPEDYHARITLVVAGWVLLAVGAMLLVRGGAFSPRVSYATTTVDVVMLTSVLIVAGGPGSPAVLGYFVLLALGPLRCDLALMRFTAIVVPAGYVVLLGWARLSSRGTTVPRYEQLTTLVALGVTGWALVRFLRFAGRLPEEYAELLDRERTAR